MLWESLQATADTSGQIHFSQLSGQEYTVPGLFIANGLDEPLTAMPIAPIAPPQPGPNTPPPPAHNGPAFWIKVSARNQMDLHPHQCAELQSGIFGRECPVGG
jgi:hypothetical protein